MIQEIFSNYLKRKGATATRMFGADGVMVNGNVMMFEWKGALVFRLSEADGPRALAFAGAAYFSPMEGGRASKTWIAIPARSLDQRVIPVADAAYAFAHSLPAKPIKAKAAAPKKAGAKPAAKKATARPAAKKKAAVKKAAKKAAPKKKVTAKKKQRA